MRSLYRVFPLTPLFTLACLGMIILIWNQAGALESFNRPGVSVAGLVSVAVGGIVAIVGRSSSLLACDLFSLGCFGTWFVHWRGEYRLDAPVFAWYPIFFVSLVLVLNQQVVHKSHLMDPVQRKMIELIHSFAFFHPTLLASGVLLSIYFSEYYFFYPILMSLFLIRCSFGAVLQRSGPDRLR